MTQRKRRSTNSRKKTSSTKSRKTKTSQRGRKKKQELSASARFKLRIFGVIMFSVLLTLMSNLYRPFVLSTAVNCFCIEPKPAEFGARTVYDAINLNHQIAENPNKKDELLEYLADEVVWFRKGRWKDKYDLRFSSRYDEFCFATAPEEDEGQGLDRNYQLRFTGYHKLRNPTDSLMAIEKYYAEIVEGRITQLYPIRGSELDKDSLQSINRIYRYYIWYVLAFWLLVLGAISYAVTLPEHVFGSFRSVLQRFIKF